MEVTHLVQHRRVTVIAATAPVVIITIKKDNPCGQELLIFAIIIIIIKEHKPHGQEMRKKIVQTIF